MTDPTRWNKEPLSRPIAADVVLRGARRPRPPGTDDLARLESVVAQIPRRSALAARRWSRLATAVAAAGIVASLGTAVWALRGQRSPMPAAAPVIAMVEMPTAAPVALRPPEAAPADFTEAEKVDRRRSVAASSGRAVAHHERPAQPAAEAIEVDTLTREIALVDAARADVNLAPARALGALDTHRREFPRGQLAAEREFLAVEALRRLNRTAEAQRRADALRVGYPSSSYAARAARLLQSAP